MIEEVRKGLVIGALVGGLVCGQGTVSASETAVTPGLVVSPPAPLAQSPRRVIEEAAILAAGLPVRLNKSLLREGDEIVATVDVPHEGFLNIVLLRSGESPLLVFPNREQAENKMPAGRWSVPNKTARFEFKATKPYGVFALAAFLSTETLDLTSAAEESAPALFSPLAAAGRLDLAKLAARSFATDQSPSLLLGGLAYGLVCAGSGSCDLASATAEVDRFARENKLTPGIFLEAAREDTLPTGIRLRGLPDKALRLAKASEGYLPLLYNDAANYCSIGYGHLVRKAPCNGSEPVALRRGIRELQADALLVEDLRRAQRAVLGLVTSELSDGQYAALCDFTYNVGSDKLEKSTLLKVINTGEHERVAAELRRWIHVNGGEYPGLRLRREREIALYFAGKRIPKTPPEATDTPIDIRIGE